MKHRIIIEYLPSLGELLDEKHMSWFSLGNNKIEIGYNDPEELFYIGIEYEKFMQQTEDED